jgi:hypothetical protein
VTKVSDISDKHRASSSSDSESNSSSDSFIEFSDEESLFVLVHFLPFLLEKNCLFTSGTFADVLGLLIVPPKLLY